MATIRSDPAWKLLPNGIAAAHSVGHGRLVVAGLRGSEQLHPDAHGHFMIVVDGLLAHNTYLLAYWASWVAWARRNTTPNWAWQQENRDRVSYSEHLA